MRIFYFFAILLMSSPLAGLSWADAELRVSGGVISDSSEASTINFDFFKDQRVIDLEDKYERTLGVLSDNIQNEPDPFEREKIQKKAGDVKMQREIEMTELQLKIAVEQGDKARELEILEALDSLYEPKVVKPFFQEPRQQPEVGNIKSNEPSNNPDDA